jgi:hypothetical protein
MVVKMKKLGCLNFCGTLGRCLQHHSSPMPIYRSILNFVLKLFELNFRYQLPISMLCDSYSCYNIATILPLQIMSRHQVEYHTVVFDSILHV